MFNWRKLKENDYKELSKWWADWRFPPPPKETLPDNGTSGIMISKGQINICAGFLYKTNSTIAFCEYTVSNFKYKEKDRKEALRFLYETLEDIAKNEGYMLLFSTVKNQNLINDLKEFGWVEGSDTKEMVKILTH